MDLGPLPPGHTLLVPPKDETLATPLTIISHITATAIANNRNTACNCTFPHLSGWKVCFMRAEIFSQICVLEKTTLAPPPHKNWDIFQIRALHWSLRAWHLSCAQKILSENNILSTLVNLPKATTVNVPSLCQTLRVNETYTVTTSCCKQVNAENKASLWINGCHMLLVNPSQAFYT